MRVVTFPLPGGHSHTAMSVMTRFPVDARHGSIDNRGMRKLLLGVTVLTAACGGAKNGGRPDGGNGGSSFDAPSGADAPIASCDPVSGTAVTRQLIADGLQRPVFVTSPPGDPRLFVLEAHAGNIRLVKDGAIQPTPFLAGVSVATGSEEGLLGLAFHPEYAANRRFFIYKINTAGNIQIVEYLASASNPDVADAASAKLILEIPHPNYSNHNGGMLAFGPDGYLYLGTGDGGGGGDPDENADKPDRLLGKLLRIDVDNPSGGKNYGAPADNPWTSGGGAPEVYAIGLRNPWRWSFDRQTGDLYIADVGQGAKEEIDVVAAGAARGQHFGWDTLEGTLCYEPGTGCDRSGKIMPVHEYDHRPTNSTPYGTQYGCSVTGGYVYRGCKLPDLRGKYFFADYCAGWVKSFRWTPDGIADLVHHPSLSGGAISSFGEDSQGELYIVELHDSDGKIYKIVPQ